MYFLLKKSLLASVVLYAFVIIAFCVAIKFFDFKDPYLENAVASKTAMDIAEQTALINEGADGLIAVAPETTPLGAVDTGMETYVKIRTAVVAIFAIIVSVGVLINYLDKRKDEACRQVGFSNENHLFIMVV